MTLRASEWLVESVPIAEGKRLVTEYHYSGSHPNTATYLHGLRHAPGLMSEVMGVAWWIPPTRTAAEAISSDWRAVLSLSRLVVHPLVPTNGASFLLGASMRLIDRERWPTLVTYADTRLGHTGAIYKATNWRCDGEVPAGDVWLDEYGRQRGRKRGGKTFTAQEMRDRGYTRAPALPKIRFVHQNV